MNRERTFRGIGLRIEFNQRNLIQRYPSSAREQILDYLFKPGFGANFNFIQIPITLDAVEKLNGNLEPSYLWDAIERFPNLRLELHIAAELVERSFGNDAKAVHRQLDNLIETISQRHHGRNPEVVLELPQESRSEQVCERLASWLNQSASSQNATVVLNEPTGYKELPLGDYLCANHSCAEYTALLDAALASWSIDQTPNNASAETRRPDQWRSTLPKQAGFADTSAVSHHINHRILVQKATKIVVTNAIDCQIPGARIVPNAIIIANDPTLETIEICENLWQIAHTTQFVAPGFFVVENESRELPNGATIVAYQSATGNERVLVAESYRSRSRTPVSAPASLGLTAPFVYVSTAENWLSEESNVFPGSDQVVDLQPNKVLTISSKAISPGPKKHQSPGRRKTDRKRFDLEHRTGPALPESFVEVSGNFTLDRDANKEPHIHQRWTSHGGSDPKLPYALLLCPCDPVGDQSVEAQCSLSSINPKRVDWVGITVSVPVMGISEFISSVNPPGITFRTLRSGAWQLTVNEMIVASGLLPIACEGNPNAWLELRIIRRGNDILAFCSNELVYSLKSLEKPTGLFGLSSGPHDAFFRHISVG